MENRLRGWVEWGYVEHVGISGGTCGDVDHAGDQAAAQPHWHITSSQALEKTFVSYAIDLDKKDFVDLLENEKQRVFDVKRIHFAMNGNWSNSETNIHKIDSEEKVLRWWFGILNHIRIELDK